LSELNRSVRRATAIDFVRRRRSARVPYAGVVARIPTMSTDDTPEEDEGADQDAKVDEEEEESFPASDPPSSWAGLKPNSGM
jgi:hypothetical protein